MTAELISNTAVNNEIFRLEFVLNGPPPKAGQFYMIRPRRSSVLLGRPISAAGWKGGAVHFLIAKKGRGTEDLSLMRSGEAAELIGPRGNAWNDFFPASGDDKKIALIGGGIGLAPLEALLTEMPDTVFDFYAGFRGSFRDGAERCGILGPALSGCSSGKLIIATEDGSEGLKGRIPDFLDTKNYAVIFACGPEAMLKAVAERCKKTGTPCYVSMERRMACGVGACLGCTIKTTRGNKRCCADGPIFPAEEILFDE
ncbi:dihydroorotate dehydrogenase B (NAD(+)), electron transfer subunit [Spirochaetia bacterium]|nr:dihydroorotate dehydrogenase B (NAD(+)), electron transfer subunit [Spirochaetia bacterium]